MTLLLGKAKGSLQPIIVQPERLLFVQAVPLASIELVSTFETCTTAAMCRLQLRVYVLYVTEASHIQFAVVPCRGVQLTVWGSLGSPGKLVHQQLCTSNEGR